MKMIMIITSVRLINYDMIVKIVTAIAMIIVITIFTTSYIGYD